MHSLIRELYPLHRSITGPGIRQTLSRLGKDLEQVLDWQVVETPTGASVLDWTVPKEWILRDATLTDADGRKIVALVDHPLSVVGYSEGIDGRFSLDQLRPHLHSLPDQPDVIPYRTSYYNPDWGFCLPHRVVQALERGEFREPFHAVIDADHIEGSLVYGEGIVRGQSTEEVLISVHVCHPGMANDNLSAIAVATVLAKRLAKRRPRYTYRFLFVPGTIGPLAWVTKNPGAVSRIKHGLVLANLGDGGQFTYQRTRSGTLEGDNPIDRAVAIAMRDSGFGHEIRDFVPYGYDERQYGSPGLNLPVGRLTRSVWAEFPEYHTNRDDLDFVRPEHLADSLELIERVFEVLEGDARLSTVDGRGEPQLGRHGLYGHLGGAVDATEAKMSLLWTLNLSDGRHSLVDASSRSGIPFPVIRAAADKLIAAGLLTNEAR
ncbi:DUF4910 domain-containing protein [soil metagenome]